ncbi:MAG: hypothetical protein OK442_01670 [Thaumarchaeota archaeon]|nr:hypothetical protein [Nitrososphaerota archaeon]
MSASNHGRHRALLFLFPFVVAVVLRIYPYLIYGVPYSTDSWSPIKNTQELLAYTPTTLGGNSVFDGYNIYWPANSLFGAVASLVFNAAPVKVMPLLFPVVGAVTVLIFFLVAEKISGSAVVASIAALFMATAGVDAIFTAAVTKETYAEPLFMVSILLLLWKTDKRSGALFAITSVTLALSHHATALLLLLVAGSIIVVDSVILERRGEPLGRKPLLLVISGGITLVYFLAYADAGLGQLADLVTVQSALLVLAFLTIFLAPVAYHAVSRPSKLLLAEGGLVLALAVGILAVGTHLTLIPTAPTVSFTLLFSAIPYVLVGVLAVFGYRMIQAAKDRMNFAFVASWLAALLGLGFLAVFSGVPDGLPILYRLLAFIGAPATILASLALQRVLNVSSGRGLTKVVVVVVILAITVPSAYQTYAASIQKESLLGGQWAYQQSDLTGAQWLSTNLPRGNLTVAGDVRMQYLLTDYLGVKVNTSIGQSYLENPGQAARPSYLVTYGLMARNGYVTSLYGVPIPRNWTGTLAETSPVLYSNGNIVIW